MEHKTLKDLYPKQELAQEKLWIMEEQLREEAIKRIKSCKRPVNFTRNDRCGHNKKEYCDVCQREIWFNNITQEDLK